MSFTIRAISEFRATEVEDAETSLNRAVELASDALVEVDLLEPFVFGELTSSDAWTLRVEFASEGDSLEELIDQVHRASRRVLEALGLPAEFPIAISQSAELVPA